MTKPLLPLLLCFALLTRTGWPQTAAPALAGPDDRFKADVLLVVAHPDDDMMVGGYLARLALDEHKHIAVVYTTNGDGGGNNVGSVAGAALGLERQIEARQALHSIGIEDVWFLGEHDTPGQNPLRSLDGWSHGKMLEEIVRLVRVTRPEVVMTWLPDQVAGENHGDHQAAGILATEAFDSSADPNQFPEQLSPSRDALTEGLQAWQAKKLYFFTDAFEVFSPYWHDASTVPSFRRPLGEANGPTYEVTGISPSQNISYAQIAAEQQALYATQEGYLGTEALKTRDFKPFSYPVHLILGKSLVGGSSTGDVFENIESKASAAPTTLGQELSQSSGLSLGIGDPWRFYGRWLRAHQLENVAALLPQPEVAAGFGEHLSIPLLACNQSPQDAVLTVEALLPSGWTSESSSTKYPVRRGECYPISWHITASRGGEMSWQELTWIAHGEEKPAGRVTVRVFTGKSGGLPQ